MSREVRSKLTAVKIRQIREPGRYADGNGLYLHVAKTGAKWWLWRGMVNGKRRELGLLSAPTPVGFVGTEGSEVTTVSLAEARAIAARYRRLARQGVDPASERDKDRDRTITFSQAVDRYLAEKLKEFRNEKHAYQWRATLAEATNVLGPKRVDEIGVADVLRILKPIGTGGPTPHGFAAGSSVSSHGRPCMATGPATTRRDGVAISPRRCRSRTR